MTMLSKRNLDHKIAGIERYIPGMENLSDFAFRITSGTTGLPSLVLLHRANTKAKQRFIVERCKDFLFLIPKRVSYFKWVNDFMRPLDGQRPIQSFLSADLDDMKSGRYEFLLSSHTPDSIISIPASYILESLNYLSGSTRERLAAGVTFVVTGGEMLSAIEREYLRRAFPRADIFDLYGSAEFDLFSISCPHLSAMYHDAPYAAFHPFDEDYALEIVNADEDGFGEIVLSSPELPRYRLGDIGALRDERCVCGMGRTLLVAGRAEYDRIAIFGLVFLAQLVMKALEPLSTHLDDYLLEVSAGEEKGVRKGKVELLVVQKGGVLSPIIIARLEDALRKLPVSKTQTLERFIESGLFEEPRITLRDHIARPSPKKIRLRLIS